MLFRGVHLPFYLNFFDPSKGGNCPSPPPTVSLLMEYLSEKNLFIFLNQSYVLVSHLLGILMMVLTPELERLWALRFLRVLVVRFFFFLSISGILIYCRSINHDLALHTLES